MTRRLLVVAAVIVAASTVSGRDRLQLRVRPAFSYAPSEVQMEFRIVPDASNRALLVSAESGDFYRSSVIELEGERAPKTVSIRYHALPAGDYSLRGGPICESRVLVALRLAEEPDPDQVLERREARLCLESPQALSLLTRHSQARHLHVFTTNTLEDLVGGHIRPRSVHGSAFSWKRVKAG